MAGDWKIGSDKRRRTTDQLRQFRELNDGQVAWDTEAPADYTYLYHPDRVLVRSEDSDAFEGALRRLDGLLEGELQREATLLDDALVRYVLPPRRGGESVPEVLDALRERFAGFRLGIVRVAGVFFTSTHTPSSEASGDQA